VDLTASTTDLAHDFSEIEPGMLLQPAVLEKERRALSVIILSRLTIAADGKRLLGEPANIKALVEKRDLQMSFHFGWKSLPRSLHLQCRLFPYDPRHRTFANFYEGERLERQEIFEGAKTSDDYLVGSRQSIGAVVRQFLFEGVHHIFIG